MRRLISILTGVLCLHFAQAQNTLYDDTYHRGSNATPAYSTGEEHYLYANERNRNKKSYSLGVSGEEENLIQNQEVKNFTPIKSGYGQYVQARIPLAVGGFGIGASYTGGYRFNKSLFLGLNIGLEVDPLAGSFEGFYLRDYYYGEDYVSAVEYYKPFAYIPLNVHFRYDIRKDDWLWNPYLSASIGAQLAISKTYRLNSSHESLNNSWDGHTYILNGNEGKPFYNHGFVGEFAVGANRRLSDKLSIYFGLSYKFHTYKIDKCERVGYYRNELEIYYPDKMINGINPLEFSFVIGLSF